MKRILDVKKVPTFISPDEIMNAYYKDIRLKKYDPCTAEEERELIIRSKAGDSKATNELIQKNLRFVVSVARKYGNQDNLADLIQEGNIGLIEAIERFDLNFNNKLISFAVDYIRRAITNFLMDGDMVQKSNLSKTAYTVNKIRENFIQKEQREPTLEEIKEILLSEYDIEILDNRDLYDLRIDSISNVDDRGDNEGEFEERCDEFNKKYYHTNDIEESIDFEFNHELLKDIMCVLDIEDPKTGLPIVPYGREFIILHYGLGYSEPMTIFEIAECTGYSSERVRQILNDALILMQEYYKNYYTKSEKAVS